jgi:hypothetical protein
VLSCYKGQLVWQSTTRRFLRHAGAAGACLFRHYLDNMADPICDTSAWLSVHDGETYLQVSVIGQDELEIFKAFAKQ